MFKIIKNFNWIILSSFLCIFMGIVTFLTFINEGFVPLTDDNLQTLLIIDIFLLVIFFTLIFRNFYRFYYTGKKNKKGSQTNLKYISVFSLFTVIPSLIVAIFSLFIFNFGIQNYFDKQITKAVNNSYDVAKNYLEESKENVLSDVILMSVGLNRASGFYYSNLNRFKQIIRSEKLLRKVDDVYLIDSLGNILLSDVRDISEEFVIPEEEDYDQALEGKPVIITNSLDNKTTVMIKLTSLVDTYLYISRNIDTEILRYLNETEQAVSFYYSVENSQTGIKITFAIIYIIVVTLLLFLSTSIAITFASRLTKPIINLIGASDSISKGALDVKVPETETDEEFEQLNKNFNLMIERLKEQQDKLLINERYEAWESVAKKLAHEIKNPLTPIQLSIDSLREKYKDKLSSENKNFEKYLETINRQIKDIEKLVNEFSNFARMPRPILKKIDITQLINKSLDFINLTSKNSINFKNELKKKFINGDEDQLNRVFINLIKNSEESISEKYQKDPNFKGNIDIEIDDNKDYIIIIIKDNGTGISDSKKAMTPYFTTKKTGTGLGLPIVSKIINEHAGNFVIKNRNDKKGTIVKISLPKYA
ncbi:MAG: HAMP domain-containing protein [Candidatus Pelagibacter sp. TMED286]|nr:MAG: HAMP domain-containing protein [Candidatus Pelagibacter sp. TMED286]|tara:strand:+ start:96 stop:1874 length:1779 start_codon:yes stop_codon:yes gene_type:complete